MKYSGGASKAAADELTEKPAKLAALPQDLLAGQVVLEPKAGCIQAASDIVGNKWTALILRDLAACPSRFCTLEKSVAGINPRILSQRLDYLEASNIIIRLDSGYALTKKGRDLIPVLEQMAAWGAKYTSC